MLSLGNIADKFLFGLVLFVLFFVPIIVLDSLYFPYITSKAFLFRTVVGIGFFVYLSLLFYDFDKYKPKLNGITISIFVFLFWMFFVNLFAENPYKAFLSNFERMEGFVSLVYLFLFYVIVSAVITKQRFIIALNVVLASFWYVGLVGISELFGKSGLVRVGSTLNNPIYLAAFSLFVFYLSLFSIFNSAYIKKPINLFYLITAVFSVIILFFTGTRGAFIALFVSLFVASLFGVFYLKDKAIKVLSYLFLGASLILSGLFVLKDTSFVQSNPYLQRYTNINLQGTIDARLRAWNTALQGVKERPIMGWGQEGYHYVFNKYYDPAMYGNETWFDRSHNMFLDKIVEGGIAGFVLFILIFVFAIFYLFKSDLSDTQKIILFALFVAYFVHNSFVFDNIVSYILIYLLLAFSSYNYGKELFGNISLKFSAPLHYSLPVMFMLGILFVYFANYPSYYANTQLLKSVIAFYKNDIQNSLRYIKEAARVPTCGSQEVAENAAKFASTIEQIAPNSAFAKEYSEFAENAIKNLSYYKKDPKVLIHLVYLYNAKKEYDKSKQVLQDIIKMYPNRQIFYIELAQVLEKEGKTEEAIKQYKKAYDILPLKQTFLIYISKLKQYNKHKELEQLLKQINQQN